MYNDKIYILIKIYIFLYSYFLSKRKLNILLNTIKYIKLKKLYILLCTIIRINVASLFANCYYFD